MLEQATLRSSAGEYEHSIRVVKPKASLVQFLRDPVAFFRAVSQHDAALAQISLGKQDFYVVSDPQVIRDILSTRGSSFEKFPQGNPKQKLFGNGLLTSEGAAQKQQRRMLLPGFHRDRLQFYTREMISCVDGLTSRWHNGDQLDFAQQMNDVTLEIIGCTLLGVHDSQLMRRLGIHLHTMLHMVDRFVVPWGDWLMKLPLPSTIRYEAAVKQLDEIIYRLIVNARRNPSPEDLIGILVESTHSTGCPLTDLEIRDEIVTMIVAGHETVAVGLTWGLHLLARHSQLQEDLAARTQQVLGSREPEAEDYTNLDFLQHVVAEALRLHPPIWLLGRRNLVDYSFRDFSAAKGSIFLVCMADLHRRESFFSDPDDFKPERWLNPDWPPYAYIPFGGGERRCIGERFAWMESVFILSRLLSRWRFTTETTKEAPAVAKLTLHPRGPVLVTVSKR